MLQPHLGGVSCREKALTAAAATPCYCDYTAIQSEPGAVQACADFLDPDLLESDETTRLIELHKRPESTALSTELSRCSGLHPLKFASAFPNRGVLAGADRRDGRHTGDFPRAKILIAVCDINERGSLGSVGENRDGICALPHE